MDIKQEIKKIKQLYESQLSEGELNFWMKYGIDNEFGGIYTAVDRDGTLLETDKSVWFQGRALWVFASAYEKYGNIEYFDAAKTILYFIENYCFDSKDGRMYFRVTKKGKPVIKRIRYIFSETFTIIGFAKFAIISNDDSYREKAFNLLKFIDEIKATDGVLIPKFLRLSEGFGEPMILLNVLSELRESCPNKKDWINNYIDSIIAKIEKFFVKDDLKLVLEQSRMDGSFDSEHFESRLLNPGHAIEGAWFIMNEGSYRNNKHYKSLGLKMLDWMFEVGWDKEFGGIIQYRDALNKSLCDYHQDMKFWWPQCEAAIATLMAYKLTNDKSYFDKFITVNKYIQNTFIDSEYGEWFGYFHRDNTLATPLKGNMYKGPFHIPRMYFKCIELLNE